MSTEEATRFIQATIAIIVAVVSLYSHKRLATEIMQKFSAFYGGIFPAERFFANKWVIRYFGLVVIAFGLGSLAFALTALFGPRQL